MKVICIDVSPGLSSKQLPPFKIGEILIAYQSKVFPENFNIGKYLYDDNGLLQSWGKYRFIPLSNIDETELLKERQSSTIEQLQP